MYICVFKFRMQRYTSSYILSCKFKWMCVHFFCCFITFMLFFLTLRVAYLHYQCFGVNRNSFIYTFNVLIIFVWNQLLNMFNKMFAYYCVRQQKFTTQEQHALATCWCNEKCWYTHLQQRARDTAQFTNLECTKINKWT